MLTGSHSSVVLMFPRAEWLMRESVSGVPPRSFYEAAPRVKRQPFFSLMFPTQLSGSTSPREIHVILLFALTCGRVCRRRISGFERAVAPSIRRLSYCSQGACRAHRPLPVESARWKDPSLHAAMRRSPASFAPRSCGSYSVSSRHIA